MYESPGTRYCIESVWELQYYAYTKDSGEYKAYQDLEDMKDKTSLWNQKYYRFRLCLDYCDEVIDYLTGRPWKEWTSAYTRPSSTGGKGCGIVLLCNDSDHNIVFSGMLACPIIGRDQPNANIWDLFIGLHDR